MDRASLEPLARSAIYELLSVGFLYPESGYAANVEQRARRLVSAASVLGRTDVSQALARLADAIPVDSDEWSIEEYTRIFGYIVSTDCPPYEAEYDQAHVFQKSQAIADLRGFYEAFGVGPNPLVKDRPDHISVELEFMHLLTLKEAHAIWHRHGWDKVQLCRKAQESFLANHLGGWAGAFLGRLMARCEGEGLYGALGRALEAQMASELAMFNIEPGVPRPQAAPAAPGVEDEAEACFDGQAAVPI
jgi:DMSO reductase family type II enzyme chaperone